MLNIIKTYETKNVLTLNPQFTNGPNFNKQVFHSENLLKSNKFYQAENLAVYKENSRFQDHIFSI